MSTEVYTSTVLCHPSVALPGDSKDLCGSTTYRSSPSCRCHELDGHRVEFGENKSGTWPIQRDNRLCDLLRGGGWRVEDSMIEGLIVNNLLTETFSTSPMRVIVSVDATPFFRASATRADVWVDCWGSLALMLVLTSCNFFYPQQIFHCIQWHAPSAGDPATWATWFIMDGSDTTSALKGVDRAGLLNDQVAHLQDHVANAYNYGASFEKPPCKSILISRIAESTNVYKCS